MYTQPEGHLCVFRNIWNGNYFITLLCHFVIVLTVFNDAWKATGHVFFMGMMICSLPCTFANNHVYLHLFSECAPELLWGYLNWVPFPVASFTLTYHECLFSWCPVHSTFKFNFNFRILSENMVLQPAHVQGFT